VPVHFKCSGHVLWTGVIIWCATGIEMSKNNATLMLIHVYATIWDGGMNQ